jgi:hypothetical protein
MTMVRRLAGLAAAVRTRRDHRCLWADKTTAASEASMTLRSRVKRLEQLAGRTQLPPWRPPDVAEMEAEAAYWRGEGPKPPDRPCPPWGDPAQWARNQRLSRYIHARLYGELAPGEYLPEMDDAEKTDADSFWQTLIQLPPPPGSLKES